MPRGEHFRGHKPENSGRKKGSVNKVTREFKSIVQDLIDENADNVRVWLSQVALGVPAEYERDAQTGQKVLVRPAVKADPEKALDLLNKLAEYAAPKLSRTEVTGPNGTPLMPPSVHLTIEGPSGDNEPS